MQKGRTDDYIRPKQVDICVPVAFATHEQLHKDAFVDTNIFVFPSNICRVECENVEITDRTITFNCDQLTLCVDYILCFKFFPKVGMPYCQTFQCCFVKEVKFKEFHYTSYKKRHISLEDFNEAQGACVEVEVYPKFGCFNKLIHLTKFDPCLTLIINFIRFNIRVKLLQDRNLIVQAIVGEPAVRLPKVVESGCGCRIKDKVYNREENDKAAGDVESALIPDIEKFKKEALEDFRSQIDNNDSYENY
ncbi:hypothetical protein JCM14036_26440 [Desulfotomaculum defluvii]